MKRIGFMLIGLLFLFVSCASNSQGTAGVSSPTADNSVVASPKTVPIAEDELDAAIRAASDYLNVNVPKGSKLLILNIKSTYPALSEYIVDMLAGNVVNDHVFTVVDRSNLVQIQQELDFQMSGEVSDETQQFIGQKVGAQTIVSGSITPFGKLWRLTVRAINVEGATVQGLFNKNIPGSATLTALTADGPLSMVSGVSTSTPAATTSPSSVSSSGTTVNNTPGKFVVVFDANGASGTVPPAEAVEEGAIVKMPDKGGLSKGDKGFEGWNSKADGLGTSYTVGASFQVYINTRFYAQWSKTDIVPDELGFEPALGWLNMHVQDGGTYTIHLRQDETTDGINFAFSGKKVKIILVGLGTGRTITLGSDSTLLTVGPGTTLILGENVTLKGRKTNQVRLVEVKGGTFVMEKGSTITENGGGGVRITSNGIFIMNGGTISKNIAGQGVGVNVESGSFTMNGGTISGNTQTRASGFRQYGGGVYISKNSTFFKSGSSDAVIYGSNADANLANKSNSNDGNAVCIGDNWSGSPYPFQRNTTARAFTALDSNKPGAEGGWE